MDIKYKITEYLNENNLFESSKSDGLIVKNENNILTIKGNPKDLAELADLLVNVAINKSHIHIDDLTLLNEKSEIKEIIIESKDK